MHQEIIEKIRKLRKKKGFDYLDMAEKLNISKDSYTRLESGKTLTWAKYIEDILRILEISAEDFFNGIGSKIKITNKKGSFGGNIHVENLFAENKDKSQKIELLYEERLKDSETLNCEIKKVNEQLMDIIKLKDKIIASMER
jgi:transcriptional regulator with XRE-family HTH domain